MTTIYCGLNLGWGFDDANPVAKYVLFVDLPNGQVSFHSTEHYGGPKYGGKCDGCHMSHERIIEFCDALCLGDAE